MKRKKQQSGNPSNAKDPKKTSDAAEGEKNAQPQRDRNQEQQHPPGPMGEGAEGGGD